MISIEPAPGRFDPRYGGGSQGNRRRYPPRLFREKADLAAGKVGEHGRALLEQLDVLVDGPFVIGLKNLGLRFRGSSNQRIIEVRPSLERGEPVLWDETSVE